MSSALRRTSRRSLVISPKMRMASPGPGKGWRQTRSSLMPSSRPSFLTSSLNSSCNGSMSLRFISSGSPPTLWWDLMTDVGPPKADLDSMISGYNVPWPRNWAPSTFLASASKTSMKSLPMIFLFFSGSVTPTSAVKNFSWASTNLMFMSRLARRLTSSWAFSFRRKSPLSTKMQCRFFPTALWIRVAATEESTPPERPMITFLSPTASLIWAMAPSLKDFMVQFCSHPQTSKRKWRIMAAPLMECSTSGWNCKPNSFLE